MAIDRELQHKMLVQMSDAYPHGVSFAELEGDEDKKIVNLLYLAEHGLCHSGIIASLGGNYGVSESAINARGIDFLEDDGGLSAILGTVTVKLHADTIRAMMIAQVDKSSATPDEKSTIKKHLAALPETALQAVTTDLVARGLAHLPDVLPWLHGLGVL